MEESFLFVIIAFVIGLTFGVLLGLLKSRGLMVQVDSLQGELTRSRADFDRERQILINTKADELSLQKSDFQLRMDQLVEQKKKLKALHGSIKEQK